MNLTITDLNNVYFKNTYKTRQISLIIYISLIIVSYYANKIVFSHLLLTILFLAYNKHLNSKAEMYLSKKDNLKKKYRVGDKKAKRYLNLKQNKS